MVFPYLLCNKLTGVSVCVWRAYGERIYVAQALVCGTRACVALTCASVCVQNMTRAQKCQEKMVHYMFITLLPSYVASMFSYVNNVFEYNRYYRMCLHVLVCYSYVIVGCLGHDHFKVYEETFAKLSFITLE